MYGLKSHGTSTEELRIKIKQEYKNTTLSYILCWVHRLHCHAHSVDNAICIFVNFDIALTTLQYKQINIRQLNTATADKRELECGCCVVWQSINNKLLGCGYLLMINLANWRYPGRHNYFVTITNYIQCEYVDGLQVKKSGSSSSKGVIKLSSDKITIQWRA